MNRYWYRRDQDPRAQIRMLLDQTSSQQQIINELQDKVRRSLEEQDSLQVEVDGFRERHEQMCLKETDMKKEIKNLKAEITHLHKQVKSSSKQSKNQKKRDKVIDVEKNQLLKESKTMKMEIDRLKKQLHDVSEMKARMKTLEISEKNYQEALKRTVELQKENRDLERQIKEQKNKYKSKIRDGQLKIYKLTTELNESKKKMEEFKEISRVTVELRLQQRLNSKLVEQKETINRALLEREEKLKEMEKNDNAVSNLRKENSMLYLEIRSLRHKYDDVKQQLTNSTKTVEDLTVKSLDLYGSHKRAMDILKKSQKRFKRSCSISDISSLKEDLLHAERRLQKSKEKTNILEERSKSMKELIRSFQKDILVSEDSLSEGSESSNEFIGMDLDISKDEQTFGVSGSAISLTRKDNTMTFKKTTDKNINVTHISAATVNYNIKSAVTYSSDQSLNESVVPAIEECDE